MVSTILFGSFFAPTTARFFPGKTHLYAPSPPSAAHALLVQGKSTYIEYGHMEEVGTSMMHICIVGWKRVTL